MKSEIDIEQTKQSFSGRRWFWIQSAKLAKKK